MKGTEKELDCGAGEACSNTHTHAHTRTHTRPDSSHTQTENVFETQWSGKSFATAVGGPAVCLSVCVPMSVCVSVRVCTGRVSTRARSGKKHLTFL